MNQLDQRDQPLSAPPTERLRVSVPEPIYSWLMQIAREDNVSMSSAVRRILSKAKREGIR